MSRFPYVGYFRARRNLERVARGPLDAEQERDLVRTCERMLIPVPPIAADRGNEQRARERWGAAQGRQAEPVTRPGPPEPYRGREPAVWRFVEVRENGVLVSPYTFGAVLVGDRVMTTRTLIARCGKHLSPPAPGCTCGVYGLGTVAGAHHYRRRLTLHRSAGLGRFTIADPIPDPEGVGAVRGSSVTLIGPVYVSHPEQARAVRERFGVPVFYVGDRLPEGDDLERLVAPDLGIRGETPPEVSVPTRGKAQSRIRTPGPTVEGVSNQ